MSVFTPDSEWRIRINSFGSTAISVALPFSVPYTTAGIRPLARSRRASFLPRLSRFSACSVASIVISEISDAKLKLRAPRPSHEQRRDRRLLVNAANRLAEQPGDRQLLDLLA